MAKRDDDAAAFVSRHAAREKTMARRAQEDAVWATEEAKWLRQRKESAKALAQMEEEIVWLSHVIAESRNAFAQEAETALGDHEPGEDVTMHM
jgi:hypothetical protein